jgi:hypothetical protein
MEVIVMTRRKLIVYSILLVGFAPIATGVGIHPNSDKPDPTIDSIERQLETGRHEQLLNRIAENDATMAPFQTDGCSGGLSLAWKQTSEQFPEIAVKHGNEPPWEECCVVHDRLYHVGGSTALSASESFNQRKDADLQLAACVVNFGVDRSSALGDLYGLSEPQVQVLYRAIAEMMYRAIRLGGIPCTDQSWRWGYGWPKCR